MKKILFLIQLIPLLSQAQIQLQHAPGLVMDLNRNSNGISGNRDVIWQEDFAYGITAGWDNNEAGGIANWEWRGPMTNPNSEIGSRGSCNPPGVSGTPIASPTGANGFVIFDSNWWDNPDNPCTPENFGTGPAPGPHMATLTTPSIDLSDHPGVALTFYQYLKMYEGQTRVEVSVGGGVWQTVFVNSALPNPTLPDDMQFVQMSVIAGGQSDVRIRFVFEGLYYFWMIDDIQIIDAFANDLAIINTNYGDFDIFDPAHPTGYEFLEYTKYPDEMPPQLKFSAQVDNHGVIAQTDCRLNVKILDVANNEVYTGQSEEGFTIPSAGTMELRSGDYQMPATTGSYRLAFETSQTIADDQPLNNQDTAFFNINDVQYARDHYYTSAIYLASPDHATLPFEIGNIYLVTADNLSVHSISVGIAVGSVTPTQIYGSIYSFDISESIEATLLGTTESIELTQEMFNGAGDQIMTNLTFTSPIAVESGTAYFVAVNCDEGPDFLVCGLSGDAEEYTAFVRYFPSEWYTIDRIPMVRMNFGFFDGIEEKNSVRSIRVYPNPADDVLNIDLTSWQHQDIELKLFDQTGREVTQKVINQNNSINTILDMKSIPAGVYHLLLMTDNGAARQKVIRE